MIGRARAVAPYNPLCRFMKTNVLEMSDLPNFMFYNYTFPVSWPKARCGAQHITFANLYST